MVKIQQIQEVKKDAVRIKIPDLCKYLCSGLRLLFIEQYPGLAFFDTQYTLSVTKPNWGVKPIAIKNIFIWTLIS